MTDDLQRYDLDFEAADSDATRKGLTRLMYRVGEECGLNHRDKSYLIEALPGKESCLLIISTVLALSSEAVSMLLSTSSSLSISDTRSYAIASDSEEKMLSANGECPNLRD